MTKDLEERNVVAIRAGCIAADAHLTCSYPTCKCKQLPTAIRAALASLRREKEELEAALRPFAKTLKVYETFPDAHVVQSALGITVGDLRRARTAFSPASSPSPREEEQERCANIAMRCPIFIHEPCNITEAVAQARVDIFKAIRKSGDEE